MEFRDAVLKRRMVRNFTPQPVDPGVVDRILDLARRGPSAGFTQGQDFIVISDPEIKKAIADICGEQNYIAAGFDPFISKAPLLIIPCTNENAYHRRYQTPDKLQEDGTEIHWPVPYWFMDVGCAVMIILLSAVDEGLAAGFAGALDLDPLRILLGIPEEVTPVGVIPIGHTAKDSPSPSLKRGRRPKDQLIHKNGW
jgi:nitroreductase